MDDIESIEKQISELEEQRKELLVAKYCDDEAIAEYIQTVGERIKKHRKKKNLTQEELAEYLQMSRSNVANIEAGRLSIGLGNVWKLCKIFQINPNVLLH